MSPLEQSGEESGPLLGHKLEPVQLQLGHLGEGV